MRAEQWGVIVAIAGGCDVTTLVDKMGSGELAGCRSIKELSEAGLVELVEAAPSVEFVESTPSLNGLSAFADLSDFADSEDPVSVDDHSSSIEPPEKVNFFDGQAASEQAEPVVGPPEGDGRVAMVPNALEGITDFDSLVTLPARARRKSDSGPIEAAPVTAKAPRRTLSSAVGDHAGAGKKSAADPDAELPDGSGLPEAQALARQLATMNDAAPESGVDEADADEPLNRGLLLKFLSSVRN
jgi:hypothetical protein